MLMTLGTFVFSIDAAAYDQLQRSVAWRHARTERVGAIAASQYVGPGEDTIELSGVIAPPLTGRHASLDTLREMGDTGRPWALVSGTGRVIGPYAITTLRETRTHFLANGQPRKVEFTLSLARVPDEAMQVDQRMAGEPTQTTANVA